jgi:hypothetical protein
MGDKINGAGQDSLYNTHYSFFYMYRTAPKHQQQSNLCILVATPCN